MARKKSPDAPKSVSAFTHEADKRKNIPTAEYSAVVDPAQAKAVPLRYPRNVDLDPQLVWRGKDAQDATDLVIHAPPLYIQEKVHPKALVDDLLSHSTLLSSASPSTPHRPLPTPQRQLDLFSDFNGIPEGAEKTDFYKHDQNWSNRMILGDSLAVMGSLAEREGLRGKVQCIYFDPPYGIKFNSNFQWSTTSRDVKDGKTDHITREPEQVKAFRDTWRDGIHSYLSYIRDRLTVARDLLTESGSIFVQIGDENVHRVRAVMDEVFGEESFAALITFRKKMMPLGSDVAEGVSDYILWYSRSRKDIKTRPLFYTKSPDAESLWSWAVMPDGRRLSLSTIHENEPGIQVFQSISLLPAQYRPNQDFVFSFEGQSWNPPKKNCWKTDSCGMNRLLRANRLHPSGSTLRYILKFLDYSVGRLTNLWSDASAAAQQVYVVQTNVDVVKRCILMTTDPGDLVLDPTCGSGTTAYVAEQWGRRWITIDTSRVALALARARIMGARYPYYLLADSPEGQAKEAEVTRSAVSTRATYGHLRHGFVYERVPHITLGAIGRNAEIDVIHEQWQPKLAAALDQLNAALKGHKTPFPIPTGGREGHPLDFTSKPGSTMDLPSGEPAPLHALLEWEVPREPAADWPPATHAPLTTFWKHRIARQKAIDASIAAKAEFEYLYDKPYEDKKKVRVAGPFTVESLSPHRMLGVDEHDNLIDPVKQVQKVGGTERGAWDFTQVILDTLRTAGVQQAHKEDKIVFDSLIPWPGKLVCAEGRYREAAPEGAGEAEDGLPKRAAILVGPEFGTVQRTDLAAAAREAAEAGFDVLIACAFNYDALSTEFTKLGRLQVLKARMNADLHMATDLKNTGKGNLFVIFGEPDVELVTGPWLVTASGHDVACWDVVASLTGVKSVDDLNRRIKTDLKSLKGDWKQQAADLKADKPFGRKRTDGAASIGQRRRALEALLSLTLADAPLTVTPDRRALVTIHGVDVFQPSTGEIRSDDAKGIACWFLDTDYNEESFFVRHAYFLGEQDPYKSLKTSLKAEIDPEAWESLKSDTSRPFPVPKSGRIAVKVINHLGDEVMKVFEI
jgi:adenine-specific DNA-methyltransferase